jgi:hypothetical protein
MKAPRRAALAVAFLLGIAVPQAFAEGEIPKAVRDTAIDFFQEGHGLATGAAADEAARSAAFVKFIARRQNVFAFLRLHSKLEPQTLPPEHRQQLTGAALKFLAGRASVAFREIGVDATVSTYTFKDGSPLQTGRCLRVRLAHAVESKIAADEALDYARRVKAVGERQIADLKKDIERLKRGGGGPRIAMPEAEFKQLTALLKQRREAASRRADLYKDAGWPDARCVAYTYALRDPRREKPELRLDLVQVGTMVVVTNIRRDDPETKSVEERLAALSPRDIDGMVRILAE